MMYALQKLAGKGYQPMIPPTLVKGFPLFGSGYFKGLEYDGSVDEVYEVASAQQGDGGLFSKEQKIPRRDGQSRHSSRTIAAKCSMEAICRSVSPASASAIGAKSVHTARIRKACTVSMNS